MLMEEGLVIPFMIRRLFIFLPMFSRKSASQKQYRSVKCQYMGVLLFFKVVISRKLVQVITPSTTVDGNIGPDAVHLLAIKEVPSFWSAQHQFFKMLPMILLFSLVNWVEEQALLVDIPLHIQCSAILLKRFIFGYYLQHTTVHSQRNLHLIHVSNCNTWPGL